MNSKLLLLAGAIALTAGGAHAQREKLKRTPMKAEPKVSILSSNASRGTDKDLKAAPTVEAFIDRLPEWGKIYPKFEDKEQKKNPVNSKETNNGQQYDVTKTDYSITTTPQEIIAFQPVNGFWLGSMVQERGIVEGIGSFTEVPIEAQKRPRIKITTDLLIPKNVETVENPSASSVQQAISQLIVRAAAAKLETGRSITFTKTSNYSQEQSALELGLDARYMGAEVKSKLKSSSSVGFNSVSAVFIEKAFTVKVDFEGRSGASAFFNNRFTMDDARKLVDRGQVSVDNMPAYLASITYGRMLVFTMTANESASDIQGAIEASYNAGVGGVDARSKYGKILNAGTTTIQVTSVGGPSDATERIIKSGKLTDFFGKTASLTTMVPISYTVNTVRENRLASMARTTDYTATTYNANNTVFKYDIQLYWKIVDADDGVLDNTVECYGELRINGAKRWEIARARSDDKANKKEAGDTIDIVDIAEPTRTKFRESSDSAKPTLVQLSGFLKDSDGGSKDDTLLSFDNFPIKLEDLAGKGTLAYGAKDILEAKFKAIGQKAPPLPIGQGAARLYIRVDKVAS